MNKVDEEKKIHALKEKEKKTTVVLTTRQKLHKIFFMQVFLSAFLWLVFMAFDFHFAELSRWVMRAGIIGLFAIEITNEKKNWYMIIFWGMYLLVLVSHILRGNISLPFFS